MTTGSGWEVHHLRLHAERGSKGSPEGLPLRFGPGWPPDAPPRGGLDLVWVRVPDRNPDPDRLAVLTAPEHERAERFRVDHARRLFVTGRWTLRHWLGARMHCPAQDVPLHVTSTGKPELPADSPDTPPWAFNLSHSGHRVLAGLQAGGRIGVDVEEVRPRRMLRDIAAHYFHPEEQALLNRAEDGEPDAEAFYRCWTLKEAFIKAIGEGLQFPIQTLNFAGLAAERGVQEIRVRDAAWQCITLPVDPGYAAAVVWEPPPSSL